MREGIILHSIAAEVDFSLATTHELEF